MTGTIATLDKGQLTAGNKAPAELGRLIDLEGWACAVVRGTIYKEPDPEFISRMLAFQIITSPTIQDAFNQANVFGLQKILPDVPDATTGPIEITDLYVASSDFETGNPSYVIMTWIHLETGKEVRCTTGATNVQATLIALIMHGMWPIRCQIKRGDQKDKGGRHLIFVLPAD